jgi:hypothetical protein
MATLCAAPNESLVKSLLDPLFGAEVTVTTGDAVDTNDGYIANYISDEDVPIAVCVADVAMVVYSGSILMMIPKGGADDAIESKDPSAVMQECFYEVANILSRAVMDDSSEHLRLEKVYPPATNTELMTSLGDDVSTVSVTVEIPGYGPGNATFIFK